MFFYGVKTRDFKIKRFSKILLIILLVVITIPATALLLVQNRQIQTALTHYLTRELGSKLQTRIGIKNISITFYNRFLVEGLYVEDQHGDTLLYCDKVKLTVRKFNRSKSSLDITRLRFNGADFHMRNTSEGSNLQFIIDYVLGQRKEGESKFNFILRRISFQDSRYRQTSDGEADFNSPVDFFALDMREVNGRLNDFTMEGDTVTFQIQNVEFTERSGFRVNNFRSKMAVNPIFINFSNLYLESPNSEISASNFRFDFEDYDDFEDFIHRVNMKMNLRSSYLSFRDLAYFHSQFSNMPDRVLISGLFSGKIDNLHGERILLALRDYTGIKGSFSIIGLPEISETFIHADIESFQTHSRDLQNFHLPGKRILTLPGELNEIGSIRYSGKFTGYMDDFVTYGELDTNLGKIITDLLITPDNEGDLTFKGSVKTRSLQVGKLLTNQETLGNLSMSAIVDGSIKNKMVSADLSGVIDSVEIYQYNYRNIILSGFLSENIFDGSFNITDPNIQMEFNGKVDFSSDLPAFNFTADVSRLRPYYLNINKSDPSYFASFLLRSNFTGSDMDNLNGEIHLVNSFFQRSEDQIQIYDFAMVSENLDDSSSIRVRSDIMDADISGRFHFSTLIRSFRHMAEHYLPSLRKDSILIHDHPDSTSFEYTAHFKDINPVIGFFTPDIDVGNNTFISGSFNSTEYNSVFTADIPRAGIKGNFWNNVQIIAESDSSTAEITAIADNLMFDKDFGFYNLILTSSLANDTVNSVLMWKNTTRPEYEGNLAVVAGLKQNSSTGNTGINLNIDPSFIIFNDTVWHIPASKIRIDSTSLAFDSLIIQNQVQKFLVDGSISEDKKTNVKISVENFDISYINHFIQKSRITLEGFATGSASLSDPYNSPLFLSDIKIEAMKFNEENIGNGEISAMWNNEDQSVHLVARSLLDRSEVFRLEGDYTPANRNLDFDVEVNKLKLAALDRYTNELVSDLKGLGYAKMTLDGTIDQPDLNGKIEFFKSSLTVDYLQTRYSFTDEITIQSNNLYFNNFEVIDEIGNTGSLNGIILSNYFRDFNLNLKFNSNYFTFLNTTEADNELFYGRVYAGGIVNVTGPPENLYMDINAGSGRNTVFYIPLYGPEEAYETDFIQFVSKGNTADAEQAVDDRYEVELSGLSMNFNIEISPNAEVQLIFDPKVGDIIRARGNGDLNIIINTQGNFEIYGEMIIEEGDYLFTLQNIINKKLEVIEGSTITMNGDPMDALIDLEAVYTLRTSVFELAYDVTPDEAEKLKKRIPVECHIHLTDKLMNPTIRRDIILPTADQQTRNIVKNSASTEEDMTKQFLYLLVMNRFFSNPGAEQPITSTYNPAAVAGVATSELLSNQLSNWLSQISNDFDIGFNYRPGDEITPDEVEVALSTQLWNDRITLNGNLDVSANQAEQANPITNTNNIVGDFDIDFQMTDNGKVHLKAFNRANDNLLFDTSPYTQGFGVFYREDFNTFGELLRRYGEAISRLFTRKKEENETVRNE